MAAQTTLHKGRILCTEDDEDSRELLQLLLQMEGFDVVCAEDSAHALDLAKSETFDLYLLDNWLPDVAGSVLCRQLRRFDLRTPILFYTGVGTEVARERAMAAGAQGYLLKPAHPDRLVAEISRLIQD